MTYVYLWVLVLGLITAMMTVLWVVSVFIRNVSIVDIFWGFGFVAVTFLCFFLTEGEGIRKSLALILVTVWGLRLTLYIAWRNMGKEEDFRYRSFRQKYGENRYWWISFFQVFLLQGVLMWLVCAPLVGTQMKHGHQPLNLFDYTGMIVWLTGFIFEAGGDLQQALFKSNPANRGKILDKGFWRYTRHPNYFGDAAVWWSFGLFSIGAGYYFPALGSILMTFIIFRVSGVTLLDKSLTEKKEGYADYIRRTSPFIPWFPKDK